MIYFYRHKKLDEYSQQEIDLLGYDGVCKFATEHSLSPDEVYHQIKQLENHIQNTIITTLDLNSQPIKSAFEKSIKQYVDYFNKNANYDKQAYILLGNISSGKSTYAEKIESQTNSIIIDSDRFKSGEQTQHGYFEGLSSFFSLTDRERLQKPCSIASAIATEQISSTGMNIIIPTAAKSIEKLEQKINSLIKNNYDIHLIYFESPYPDLANRNYYRYLVQEFKKEKDPNGNIIHGRFVPVSIIKSYGESCFATFANSLNDKRFKSYKAFYNDNNSNGKNEEIDLETMEK